MKNLVLFVILTALVTGIAYFLLSVSPKNTPLAPLPRIEYEFIDAELEDDLDFQIQAKAINPSQEKTLAPMMPKAQIKEEPIVEKQSEKSEALFTFNMGEYDITLKGGLWKIKLTPIITTYHIVTLQALRSSIENLRRILFFLGSHRVIEGLQDEAGIERFEKDYLERVKNIIRVGEINGLSFSQVKLYENPNPPPQNSEIDEIPIRRSVINEEEQAQGNVQGNVQGSSSAIEQAPMDSKQAPVKVYDPSYPTYPPSSNSGHQAPSQFKPNRNGVDESYEPKVEQ